MSKTSGYENEAIGKVKENVGWATGNDKLEAEGKAQHAKGEVEVEVAKTVERVKGTGEQIKGAIKETAGKLTGNEQLECEGKGDRLTGDVRKALNE